jgi:hypothetical protein
MPVASIVSWVALGHTFDEIQEVHPGITLEDVRLACWYSAKYGHRRFKPWRPWADRYLTIGTDLPPAIV